MPLLKNKRIPENTLLASGIAGFAAAAVLSFALLPSSALLGASLKTGALSYMSPLIIGTTSDPESAMRIGYYYFNGGDYDLERAEEAFKKALALDPVIPRAHYQLARILFIKGDFHAALRELNLEMEHNPELPNTYYVRGLINGFRKNFGAAEADFRRFTELSPRQWAGYNDLAWVLAQQSKFTEAKETVLAAFEKIPGEAERNLWLWTSLGVALLNMGAYNEAEAAFSRAESISDTVTAEYFWSAYPGNDPRNADDAFKQFQASLTLNLAITRERLGQLAEAHAGYESYLLSIPPGDFPKRNEIEQRLKALDQTPVQR